MAIEGTYNIVVSTPMGNQESTLTLKTDGDSLSGKSKSQFGEDEFSGGKVDGNNFEFELQSSSPMGKMKLDFTGTVDGDKISGSAKSMFGDAPYEGSRA